MWGKKRETRMTKKQIKEIQDLCAGVAGVLLKVVDDNEVEVTTTEHLKTCPYCQEAMKITADTLCRLDGSKVCFSVRCQKDICPSMPTIFGDTLRQAIDRNNTRTVLVPKPIQCVKPDGTHHFMDKFQPLIPKTMGVLITGEFASENRQFAVFTVAEPINPCPYCGLALAVYGYLAEPPEINEPFFGIACVNKECVAQPNVLGSTLREAIDNNNHRSNCRGRTPTHN
jgi:hypothetical protein